MSEQDSNNCFFESRLTGYFGKLSAFPLISRATRARASRVARARVTKKSPKINQLWFELSITDDSLNWS